MAAMRVIERIAPVLFLLFLIGCWQILPSKLGIRPYIFPQLSTVISEGRDNVDLIIENGKTTLFEALTGLGLGTVVGVTLGIAVATSTLLRRMLLPYIVGSNSIPTVAVAPLVVMWFGHG